jgi:hypothetical protein
MSNSFTENVDELKEKTAKWEAEKAKWNAQARKEDANGCMGCCFYAILLFIIATPFAVRLVEALR